MQKKERQTVTQQRIQQRKEQRIQQEQKKSMNVYFVWRCESNESEYSTSKVNYNSEEGGSQKKPELLFFILIIYLVRYSSGYCRSCVVS